MANSPRDPVATNLIRVNDHPDVDFRRLTGQPHVVWIHANSFLAAAHPDTESELAELLKHAIEKNEKQSV